MKKDKNELKAEWKKRPLKFRIEAVIHDGQWYTFDKWKRVALVKDENDLLDWIHQNQDILIKKDESYRVPYDEVIKWYKEHDLPLDEPLIPNNFAPRLWSEQTEAEAYLNAPRRLISALLIEGEDSQLEKKCISILNKYARIVYHNNKLYAYGLNANYFKDLLKRQLSASEYDRLKLRLRSSFYRRDLLDLTDEFVAETLLFYYSFAVLTLKPHDKTINIYLPEHDEKRAQIYEWILTAMQKFDETQPIPFSGYLSNVLRLWPYDLPDNELGKPLSKFQRIRAKAEEELSVDKETNEKRIVPISEIQQYLSDTYTEEQFRLLEEQHQRWLSTRNTDTLVWQDTNEDKAGINVFKDTNFEDTKRAHNITRAILRSSIKAECPQVAINLIEDLGSLDFDLQKMKDLPVLFKTTLVEELLNNEESEEDE